MLLFCRMLRVVTLKCLTKEHVHVWKSVVHEVIRMFTNRELACYMGLFYQLQIYFRIKPTKPKGLKDW